MLYDSDRSRNIETIDKIMTVFAFRYIKCHMQGFGCCQTSWVTIADPPNMLSHIRYESYRATFTATGVVCYVKSYKHAVKT